MTIGLIGRGYVGNAVERLLAPHHEVLSWDLTDPHPRPDADLADCDVVVVAVGTPTAADGSLDFTAVEDVISSVPNQRFLLKSTVPPGTTERLVAETGKEICFWPEYVGESKYHNPFFPREIAEVPFAVLGGVPETTRWALHLLQPILGPTKTYYRCTALEGEMIKLAENSYLAAKVTFVNEIKQICDAVGADWDNVREGWLLDPRVERMHTLVMPGNPGFGGACLPKDVNGIVAAARKAGYEPAFLAEVLASNDRFRS